jgi:transcription termination factor Rho
MAVLDRNELEQSPLSDLHAIASELGIEGYRLLRREKLIDAILGEESSGASPNGDAADSDSEEKPRRRRSRGGRGRKRPDDEGGGAKTADRGDADDDADDDSDDDKPAPRSRGRGRQPRGGDRDREPRGGREPRGEREDRDDDADEEPGEPRSGVLDILPNGSGFMRPQAFVHSAEDVYVAPAQIRRLELRPGDEIEGPVRPPRRNERHPSLQRIDKVNGAEPGGDDGERKRFDDLTPVFATQRLNAPDGLDSVPFGRGSRVAVGGPPGAGITNLLRQIATSLAGQDLEVVIVLAGTRPEEVTEWRRDAHTQIAGGAFDRPVDEQSQAAEMAVERGKRAVEQGRHAAIVIDSLDALPPSVARRVFGAARATEEAGTLTVVAATGLAGEPMRVATTRIVLDPHTPGAAVPEKPKLAPTSGTLRADLLS